MNTLAICIQDGDQIEPRSENDRRRFDAMVRRHSSSLYRYAVWLCDDRALAQDLVQETLLRAWRSFASLSSEAAEKAWLVTILRRERARHYATLRRHDSLDEADDLPSPEVGYDTSTEAFVLRRALAELPQEYREPLILQVLFGLDLGEIAQIAGISRAGVATRVFRARQKLREALGEPEDTAAASAVAMSPTNGRGQPADICGAAATQSGLLVAA